MPKNININPPNVCKYFAEIFLAKFVSQKPHSDIIKDIIPILKQDKINDEFVKLMLTPEIKASILVAIPSNKRHFMLMHSNLSTSSDLKAFIINI